MESLPKDIILLILDFLPKITDKHNFSKTFMFFSNCRRNIIKNTEQKIIIPNLNFTGKYCVEIFRLDCIMVSYFHLIPQTYLLNSDDISVATLSIFGNLKLLKQFIKNYNNTHEEDYNKYWICTFAAIVGHLDILKWARLSGGKFCEDTYVMAVVNGHLHVLEYLVKYMDMDFELVNLYAIKNNHLHILRWIKKHNFF